MKTAQEGSSLSSVASNISISAWAAIPGHTDVGRGGAVQFVLPLTLMGHLKRGVLCRKVYTIKGSVCASVSLDTLIYTSSPFKTQMFT